MRLSAPKFLTWLIALIVGGLGIALHIIPTLIPGITLPDILPFWLVVVGFLLLLIGNLFKGI